MDKRGKEGNVKVGKEEALLGEVEDENEPEVGGEKRDLDLGSEVGRKGSAKRSRSSLKDSHMQSKMRVNNRFSLRYV